MTPNTNLKTLVGIIKYYVNDKIVDTVYCTTEEMWENEHKIGDRALSLYYRLGLTPFKMEYRRV